MQKELVAGDAMKLVAVGLFLLAAQAYAGTVEGTLPKVLIAEEEPRYPIGGTFFTGSSEALIKLRDFARQKGFMLDLVTLPDGDERLPITSSLLSNKAFIEIFNEAQSGRFGELKFAIMSGPLPAQAH